MSFLRVFLVKQLSLPFDSPHWHEKYSTARLWRWYEQLDPDRSVW